MPYILSFIFFQLLAFLNSCKVRLSFLLPISSLLLFFIAFVFSYDSYVDRVNYIGYYNVIASGGYLFVEPAFYFIAYISKVLTGGPFLIFPIFASIGVLLKIYILNRMSPNIYLSLLVYLSYFYILHDNAQIRIGAAMTFVLLAVYFYYYLNSMLRIYLLFVLIGLMFHISVIVFAFIPMVISRGRGLHTQFVFMATVSSFVLMVAHLLGYSALDIAMAHFTVDILESDKYSSYVENAQSVGLYNAVVKLVPAYLIILLYLIFSKRIIRLFPEASVYVRILCLGTVVFSLLAPFQTIAYRIFDLFYFFSILLIPIVALSFRIQIERYVFVFCLSVIYFVYVHFVIDFVPA